MRKAQAKHQERASLQRNYANDYSNLKTERRTQLKDSNFLERPSLYIGAIIAAFLLYHIDQRYDINSSLRDLYSQSHEVIDYTQQHIANEYTINGLGLFVITILIITFVMALRKVRNSSRKVKASPKKQVEWLDGYNNDDSNASDSDVQNKELQRTEVACERISKEEF